MSRYLFIPRVFLTELFRRRLVFSPSSADPHFFHMYSFLPFSFRADIRQRQFTVQKLRLLLHKIAERREIMGLSLRVVCESIHLATMTSPATGSHSHDKREK